jgi:hypothetical protein
MRKCTQGNDVKRHADRQTRATRVRSDAVQSLGDPPRAKKFPVADVFLLQPRAGLYKSRTSNRRGRSSGVEHNLAKVRVVSSNLIARSSWTKPKSRL